MMTLSQEMSSLVNANQRFSIAHFDDVQPVACPCGQARRAFTDDPDQVASLHLVEVTTAAQTHYHKQLTELYYILEGTGQLELDGELHSVRPGSTILIKPGCRHRAIGRMKILNLPVPAFDPENEWFE